MLYDFHTHTFLSDGVLSPLELIRRAHVNGYRAIALTDHIALGSMERILEEISQDCALARKYWDILAIPGVELTHLPSHAIDTAAKRAKQLGAWLVVVHGETISEPVEQGTNLAAVQSSFVDILAHPGLLTREEAQLAAEKGIFLEITARDGHSCTNEHVASLAQEAQANLIINSDAHDIPDLLTLASAANVARTARLDEETSYQTLKISPLTLMARFQHRI